AVVGRVSARRRLVTELEADADGEAGRHEDDSRARKRDGERRRRRWRLRSRNRACGQTRKRREGNNRREYAKTRRPQACHLIPPRKARCYPVLLGARLKHSPRTPSRSATECRQTAV